MKKVLIALSAMLLFISCDRNYSQKEPLAIQKTEVSDLEETSTIPDKKNENFVETGGDTAASPQQNGPDKSKQNQRTPMSQVDWDKKIVKNATLNLEVKDFNAYNTLLRGRIKQFGGYVAQEEQSQSEYKIETILTIKVPVDQFDDVVNSISANAKELKEKKITSQDVTSEVIDTRSRIETKKQVRLKYLDLLKQARNMEEILSVQSQVNGIQEQIESAAGRIEYLSHSSSFSTINLTFYQVLNASAIDADKISFSTKLGDAFKNGWSWVGEVFIGIISIWPLLLMIFAGFLIYKKTRAPKIKQA